MIRFVLRSLFMTIFTYGVVLYDNSGYTVFCKIVQFIVKIIVFFRVVDASIGIKRLRKRSNY